MNERKFNRNAACTIITADYLDYALTLFESMRQHSGMFMPMFHVLVVGPHKPLEAINEKFAGSIEFHTVDGLKPADKFSMYDFEVDINQYSSRDNLDSLRWSLKPEFILFLLYHYGYFNVTFLDCDLYFVNNFDVIYYELDKQKILLTPHDRSTDPKDAEEFRLNFLHGLFNAGFFGINEAHTRVLYDWAEWCKSKCEIDTANGCYVDQRYLDLLALKYYDDVTICKHEGCNVAIWNTKTRQRSSYNGEVIINQVWPIIFIHMSTDARRKIDVHDKALSKYLETFVADLGQSRDFISSNNLEIVLEA